MVCLGYERKGAMGVEKRDAEGNSNWELGEYGIKGPHGGMLLGQ